MASSADMMIAIIGVLLILQPRTAMGDTPSPFLPPVIGGNICKAVECGKGTCKPSGSSSFQFECVCDAGWKQTQSDHEDKYAYLPCVIPNCNLDYTCQETGPPPSPSNLSIIDPCYWTNCGRGTCKTAPSTLFAPTCECSEGYSNLFNTPSFPCVKPCGIGGDCSSLGLDLKNKSATTPTNLADNGSTLSRGSLGWMGISMLLLIPFMFK